MFDFSVATGSILQAEAVNGLQKHGNSGQESKTTTGKRERERERERGRGREGEREREKYVLETIVMFNVGGGEGTEMVKEFFRQLTTSGYVDLYMHSIALCGRGHCVWFST